MQSRRRSCSEGVRMFEGASLQSHMRKEKGSSATKYVQSPVRHNLLSLSHFFLTNKNPFFVFYPFFF
ncbi:hypothetical protein L6452_00020 [Arctium lappa]|uniref:Uncharacterized protein n=1 Tax=Arctium lappa TaxID=4217 RepID=A0ACB9FC74_ARCLA|nr:hypothetical protein L6452_00020 [Arctium lappa]